MKRTPGRNDACPCGSGKKYKRCCLDKDAAASRHPAAPAPLGIMFDEDDDELEDLSNGVLDLIDAGKFTEAEERCRLLASRFPEKVDHIERLADVRDAQGRFAEAAVLWQQAADFARAHESYHREIIEFYEERSQAAAARG